MINKKKGQQRPHLDKTTIIKIVDLLILTGQIILVVLKGH
jgi:hypothetical protein